MNKQNQEAIILSFDGIVFNLNQVLIDSFQTVARKHQLEIPENFFDIYLEGGYQQRHRAFIHYHYLEPIQEELHQAYLNQIEVLAQSNQLPLVDDLQAILDYIHQHQLKLGLISSLPTDLTKRLLATHPLIKEYDALVCGNEVLEGKPESDLYTKCLRQLNVISFKALCLETTLNGVQGSYLANCSNIYIETLYLRKEKIQKFSHRQVPTLLRALELF